MNTNNFKVNDVVCVSPFGETPFHYCKIEYFKEWEVKPSPVFAMGKWYSKKGNCMSGTGFDVNYISKANKWDLIKAMAFFVKKYHKI